MILEQSHLLPPPRVGKRKRKFLIPYATVCYLFSYLNWIMTMGMVATRWAWVACGRVGRLYLWHRLSKNGNQMKVKNLAFPSVWYFSSDSTHTHRRCRCTYSHSSLNLKPVQRNSRAYSNREPYLSLARALCSGKEMYWSLCALRLICIWRIYST